MKKVFVCMYLMLGLVVFQSSPARAAFDVPMLSSASDTGRPALPPMSEDDGIDIYEIWPFPLGAECSFPWDLISGLWMTESDIFFPHYFEFLGIREEANGDRYFEINWYNWRRELVAKGRGISQSGRKIIRATMLPPTLPSKSRYVVYVRSLDKQENGCADKDTVSTVVTIHDLTQPSIFDMHYEVSRIGDSMDDLELIHPLPSRPSKSSLGH